MAWGNIYLFCKISHLAAKQRKAQFFRALQIITVDHLDNGQIEADSCKSCLLLGIVALGFQLSKKHDFSLSLSVCLSPSI